MKKCIRSQGAQLYTLRVRLLEVQQKDLSVLKALIDLEVRALIF